MNLSDNNLTGPIPQELAQLHLLNVDSQMSVGQSTYPAHFSAAAYNLKRTADRAEVTFQGTCQIFRRTFAANAVRQRIPRP